MSVADESGVLAVAHRSRSVTRSGLRALTHHPTLQVLLRYVSRKLHRVRARVLPVFLEHPRTVGRCLLATLTLTMHPTFSTGLELGLDVDFLLDVEVLFGIEVRGVCARHIESFAALERVSVYHLTARVVLEVLLRWATARVR